MMNKLGHKGLYGFLNFIMSKYETFKKLKLLYCRDQSHDGYSISGKNLRQINRSLKVGTSPIKKGTENTGFQVLHLLQRLPNQSTLPIIGSSLVSQMLSSLTRA